MRFIVFCSQNNPRARFAERFSALRKWCKIDVMSIFLYPVYALFHLVLLFWGIWAWMKTKDMSLLITIGVSFGLVYDNLVLSIGIILPPGELLYYISFPRFILHQLVLPWIIYASYLCVLTAGISPLIRRSWVVLLSFIVMGLGIFTRVLPLKLEPVLMDGVYRYVFNGAAGPPIVSILAIGFSACMGFLLWRKLGWPWVFITSVLVFVGEGIPVEMIRRSVGSGGEVLFILAMIGTSEMFFKTKPTVNR